MYDVESALFPVRWPDRFLLLWVDGFVHFGCKLRMPSVWPHFSVLCIAFCICIFYSGNFEGIWCLSSCQNFTLFRKWWFSEFWRISHIPGLRDDNQLHVLMWICWHTVIIGVWVCFFGIVGHTHSSAIMSRTGEGELPGCSVLASLSPALKRTVDAMLSNFPGFVTICSEQDAMSLCKQIVLFAYLLFTGTERWHK